MTAERVVVADLQAGYGGMTVLHDISLDIPAGGALGIIGPNGAGKTTLLKVLAGLIPLMRGTLTVGGEDFSGVPSHVRVARGLALVPEGRQVIGSLTVRANLDITMFSRGRMRPDEEHENRLETVYELFPVLSDRREQTASSLSGGEQQMLAFGRALMTHPDVLLVDEPSQGLAPRIVEQVGDTLLRLKGDITLIIVEQHQDLLERVADDVVALRLGRVVEEPTDGTAHGA